MLKHCTFALLFAALLGCAFAQQLRTEAEYRNLYEEFLLKHNKKYGSVDEVAQRFAIFKATQDYIDRHNAQTDKTFTRTLRKRPTHRTLLKS